MTASGAFAERRAAQAAAWMHDLLRERLLTSLYRNQSVTRRLPELEAEVRAGKRTPALAVAELMTMIGLQGAAGRDAP
jgi:LAO/AO transport system kinase